LRIITSVFLIPMILILGRIAFSQEAGETKIHETGDKETSFEDQKGKFATDLKYDGLNTFSVQIMSIS
jgi:hypothetical protein